MANDNILLNLMWVTKQDPIERDVRVSLRDDSGDNSGNDESKKNSNKIVLPITTVPAIIIYPSLTTPAVIAQKNDKWLEIILLVKKGYNLEPKHVNEQLKISLKIDENYNNPNIWKIYEDGLLFESASTDFIIIEKEKTNKSKKKSGDGTYFTSEKSVSGIIDKKIGDKFADNEYTDLYSVTINIQALQAGGYKPQKRTGRQICIQRNYDYAVSPDDTIRIISEKHGLTEKQDNDLIKSSQKATSDIGKNILGGAMLHKSFNKDGVFKTLKNSVKPQGQSKSDKDYIFVGDYSDNERIPYEIQDVFVRDVMKNMETSSYVEEKGNAYCFGIHNNENKDIDLSTINYEQPIQALHPVIIFPTLTNANVGHLTDLHLVSRQQILAKSNARVIELDEKTDKDVSPEIGDLINIYSRNVIDLLDKYGNDPEIDMVLITGDLIDHIPNVYKPDMCKRDASGKIIKTDAKEVWDTVELGNSNYKMFTDHVAIYTFIVDFYQRYRKPVYLVSGNHDCYARAYGISPRVMHGRRNAGIGADHNLTIYEGILAFGKSYDGLAGFNLDADMMKEDKFIWFYSAFTPLSSFMLELPKQLLVGLGWGYDESKLTTPDYLPRAFEAVSDNQFKLLEEMRNWKKRDEPKPNVLLMSHFTFISYVGDISNTDSLKWGNSSDKKDSDNKERLMVKLGSTKQSDSQYGDFKLKREEVIKKMLIEEKLVSCVFTGHSHRRGLYTFTNEGTKGFPVFSSASVLTQVYDFKKIKEFISVKPEGYPVIIASDSIGPIPRANYDDEFLGWGSQYPSGTKVVFSNSGDIVLPYNIGEEEKGTRPVEIKRVKPRVVVALDYVDLECKIEVKEKVKSPASKGNAATEREVTKKVQASVIEKFECEMMVKSSINKDESIPFSVKLNGKIMKEDINSVLAIEKIKVYIIGLEKEQKKEIPGEFIKGKDKDVWEISNQNVLDEIKDPKTTINNYYMAIKFAKVVGCDPKFDIYDYDSWWNFEVMFKWEELMENKKDKNGKVKKVKTGDKYTFKRDNSYGGSADVPDFKKKRTSSKLGEKYPAKG